uniref:Mitochondrial inner membrane protease ATP23 n=1 Tax=Glossina palpalis gambiensis TaxID=67801 RepID=A0A1B0C5I8_9MUSC
MFNLCDVCFQKFWLPNRFTQPYQIVVCQNMARKQGMVKVVLTNEMIHMFDYCNNELDFRNIDHLKCVKTKALASALAMRNMSRQAVIEVMERIFHRCYNDLERNSPYKHRAYMEDLCYLLLLFFSIYITAFIPNLTFSKLLFKYANLWGLDKRRIDWDVAARQLAADLTNTKKLNKTEGTARTGLCAFLWYALKLELRHAEDRLTKQFISDGKINIAIERDSDGFLGFNETQKMDKRFLPYINQVTDQIINGMTMRLIKKLTDELTEEILSETVRETTGE